MYYSACGSGSMRYSTYFALPPCAIVHTLPSPMRYSTYFAFPPCAIVHTLPSPWLECLEGGRAKYVPERRGGGQSMYYSAGGEGKVCTIAHGISKCVRVQ